MKIISVNIQKGGCGKTTTVQAIAEILSAEYGKRVLCIDTDAQCNLSTISGIDLEACQDNTLYDLLRGDKTISQCIVKTKYYDLVPSSIYLSQADIEFSRESRDRYMLSQLQNVTYDFVLIDTPPALGYLNSLSLSISDSVLIPTECSYLAMLGLDQLNSTISRVKKLVNPNLKLLGILMIKYNARTTLNNAIFNGMQDMAADMNTKVFDTKIRETIKIREAQSQTVPLTDWAIDCSAMQDYRNFVHEVMPNL